MYSKQIGRLTAKFDYEYGTWKIAADGSLSIDIKAQASDRRIYNKFLTGSYNNYPYSKEIKLIPYSNNYSKILKLDWVSDQKLKGIWYNNTLYK